VGRPDLLHAPDYPAAGTGGGMDQRNVIEIGALDDPRLDDYRDIRDRELMGRQGFPGLFVAEQPLVVERMLAVPGAAKSVLIGPNWVGRIAPLAPAGVPVYVAPPPLLKRVAGFNIHRGVLGIGWRHAIERQELPIPPRDEPATLLLAEDIRNIDNIGFLFRNAAAFGAQGVLLSPTCHDPLYRKSLRVSTGHALTVPFARSRCWVEDLRRLRREHGVTLIAAALDRRSVDLDSVPRPWRVGLIVGQEYVGLPEATLAAADHVVRIPMAPGIDSLNVAVAAAICLHRLSNARRL
jgi:tRNA G18 (ribose-2'-O)-methylase SpoU